MFDPLTGDPLPKSNRKDPALSQATDKTSVAINPHNDDEVREMNRKELVAMVQDPSTPAAVRLACIKELGDRIDGRAAAANPPPPPLASEKFDKVIEIVHVRP